MSTRQTRRQTLAAVSESTLNSRTSMGRASLAGTQRKGAARMSLDPRRMSIDPQRSLSIGNASARKSSARRSSAYGASRGVPDPRPLGEKAYMNNAIREVLNFCLDNNYEQRMDFAAKPNWRPTAREFQDIAIFLFKKLDPNWQLTAKFEEEFIAIFKWQKYPYTISKTSLYAVGSPHAWPQLLGAIEWLVEILNYDKLAAEKGGHTQQAFGGAVEDLTREGDQRFVKYLDASYKAFLAGNDEHYAALEKEFSASFTQTTAEVGDLVKSEEGEQARLMTEIETEKSTGASVPEKKKKLAVLNNDHAKLEDFVKQLKEHESALDQKVATKRKDLSNGSAELAECKEKIVSLKERIAKQKLSADEARRMVDEKGRLEKNVKEATEYHQAMNQKAWEGDMELNRGRENLERAVHQYGTLATQLQLLPFGAKNANGVDFRILVNGERIGTAACLEDVISTDVTATIVPALRQKKDLVAKKGQALRESVNALQDKEEQSRKALESVAESLEKHQARHSKLEDQLRQQKEGLTAALTVRAEEQEALESEAELLQDNPAERERRRCESQKRIALVRSRQQEAVDRHHREAAEAAELVAAAIAQLTSFKDYSGRRLTDLRETMDAMQTEFAA